jgi:hypothetical protein
MERLIPQPTDEDDGPSTPAEWAWYWREAARFGFFAGAEEEFASAISRFDEEVAAGDPRCPTWDELHSIFMRAQIRGSEFETIPDGKTLHIRFWEWCDWCDQHGWPEIYGGDHEYERRP